MSIGAALSGFVSRPGYGEVPVQPETERFPGPFRAGGVDPDAWTAPKWLVRVWPGDWPRAGCDLDCRRHVAQVSGVMAPCDVKRAGETTRPGTAVRRALT